MGLKVNPTENKIKNVIKNLIPIMISKNQGNKSYKGYKGLTPMLPAVDDCSPGKTCSKGVHYDDIPFLKLAVLFEFMETYGNRSH